MPECICYTDNIGDENVHHLSYSCGLRHLDIVGLIPRKSDCIRVPEPRKERRKILWGLDQGRSIECMRCGRCCTDQKIKLKKLSTIIYWVGARTKVGVAT